MMPAMPSGADYTAAVLLTGGAILLAWSGLPRLVGAGWRRRLTGGAEVAAAVAVLLLPGSGAAALLALIFLGFTLVHVRGIGTAEAGCDCFGDAGREQVSPARAAALTAVVALLAAASAVGGAPSMRELASADPSALEWVPAAALVASIIWRLAFSGLGLLERISDASAATLEQGLVPGLVSRLVPGRAVVQTDPDALIERRSFLLQVAVIGSAMAISPHRFMVYPGTALNVVVGPWDCPTGRCHDGYTEFCCEINTGGVNECPVGTFAGGWWMCTDYAGRRLCSDQGVRYYVDCNALPGQPFPGGCRCGQDNCNNRRVACNVFRYGQCNTEIDGRTAVVCRMVLCENPARVSELGCSAARAVDNATCGHEAPCLEPPALELVGAGGA